eukprot:1235938-Pyramimonas_sp.AAC.1
MKLASHSLSSAPPSTARRGFPAFAGPWARRGRSLVVVRFAARATSQRSTSPGRRRSGPQARAE